MFFAVLAALIVFFVGKFFLTATLSVAGAVLALILLLIFHKRRRS